MAILPHAQLRSRAHLRAGSALQLVEFFAFKFVPCHPCHGVCTMHGGAMPQLVQCASRTWLHAPSSAGS